MNAFVLVLILLIATINAPGGVLAMDSEKALKILDTLETSVEAGNTTRSLELAQSLYQAAVESGTPLTRGNQATFLYFDEKYNDKHLESLRLFGVKTDNELTSVGVSGYFDPEKGKAEVAMTTLGDVGVWMARIKIQSDAEFLYHIKLNESYIPDPVCKVVFEGFGPNSVGRMPDFKTLDSIVFRPDIEHGRIETFEIVSKNFEEPWRIYVYLPPGYEASGSRRYPVLYQHDGDAALTSGHLDRIVDNLIARNEIKSLILRCIPPGDRLQTYWLNDVPYVDFMVNELVPLIDKRYRTLPDAKHRAVAGESVGGRMVSQIVSKYPDKFSMCIAQSSYFNSDSSILERIATNKLPVRFYIDVGIYERDIGKGLKNDGDLLRQNREIHEMLKSKGYDVIYREWPGGHHWLTWDRGLDTALRLFWPKDSYNKTL